jgi:hypothetical protein
MTITPTQYADAVRRHVHSFFEGHQAAIRSLDRGPIQSIVPGFHAIEVAPGPRQQVWTYVSVGAGYPKATTGSLLEFILVAAAPDERHVEIVAMTTHYHLTGESLGVGHTFPIGQPLLPGSTLDQMLVSLPYPFRPELEILKLGNQHVHLVWLLPITKRERDFKIEHGLEALEARFDEVGLCYWDARRASVV